MTIVTLENKIAIPALEEMAKKMFGSLVKAAIDVEKEIMIVDAGLHSDEELLLMENRSSRFNIWGINIHPQFWPDMEKFVEFDSMINLKPALGNRTRGVDNEEIREKIKKIVMKLISENGKNNLS